MGVNGIEGGAFVRANTVRAADTPAPKARPTETYPSQKKAEKTSARTVTGRPEQARRPADSILPQRKGTRLRLDDVTHQVVTQIIGQNNEVVKQIPPKELLDLAARVRKTNALLFDEKG